MVKSVGLVAAAAVLGLYALGPFFAGLLGIGQREGPRIYPEGYHTALFIIGYEALHESKPRLSISSYLYHRPLFYGFMPQPKSQSERDRIIETSPFQDILKEENERINKRILE